MNVAERLLVEVDLVLDVHLIILVVVELGLQGNAAPVPRTGAA